MLGIVVSLLLCADPEVSLTSRAVPGSDFAELTLVAVVTGDVESLCARVFGTGRAEPDDAHLLARRVLWSSADERLTYEQIAPPLVSHRDFGLRSRRTRPRLGQCRVDFAVDNGQVPPLQPGWVRIEKLTGSFVIEALGEGRIRVTHVIHMDPGGAIPAWLAETTRREMSLARMKRLLSSATEAPPVASGPR